MNKTFTQITRFTMLLGAIAMSSAVGFCQVSDATTVIDQTFEYFSNASASNSVTDAPQRSAAATATGFMGTLSGNTVTVSATTGYKFCAFQFDITGVGTSEATDVALASALTAETYGFQVAYNTIKDETNGNTVRVIAYNMGNNEFTATADAIATITLSAAPTGTLGFANVLSVSADDVTKDIEAAASETIAAGGKKGDVDKSGDVSVSDLTAILDIILERDAYKNNPNNYDLNAARLDDDENISVSDISKLLDIILER